MNDYLVLVKIYTVYVVGFGFSDFFCLLSFGYEVFLVLVNVSLGGSRSKVQVVNVGSLLCAGLAEFHLNC